MSNDEMSTQPTIETLLARLNEWGERFTSELATTNAGLDELRKGQDELRKSQQELRADLRTGLHRVERKIEILNDNFLTIRSEIRDLEVRVEKLETETPAEK
ncbi:MAG TPA: hypothetical protein VLM38_15970 [Blastocatellia bacterium]|nr:hypothetical protein [Blastocatellia bacterium]